MTNRRTTLNHQR